MQRVRARLAAWAALALALFVSSITTPRAGLYFHRHASGDHAHVHLDGEDHAHNEGEPQHHHHTHLARAAAHGPVIEAPDGDDTGHWHSQDFFHRAVAPAVPVAQHGEPVALVHTRRALAIVDRPALPVRVRGPPHSA